MKIIDKISARNARMYEREPASIVCLGDSVTHGCFGVFKNRFGMIDTDFQPALSYARLLEDELFRLYPMAACNVINRGISGDSSGGALKRFARDVAILNPDLVIINLGLNDCMAEHIDAALDAYAENMRALFIKARQINAECVLLTPNMMCQYVDSELEDDVLKNIAAVAVERQTGGTLTRFVDAAREIARSVGAPIADAYSAWQALDKRGVDTTKLLINRINHPEPRMHELFLRKLLDALFM